MSNNDCSVARVGHLIVFPLLVLITIVTGPMAFSQESRVALVIGNENYLHSLPLYNPVNDANAISESLGRAGFRVFRYVDAGKESMSEAIEKFRSELPGKEVALFFYAGHGFQVNGKNYLVPVDARPVSEESVAVECVEAQSILDILSEADIRTRIIILDACRDNPFSRSWRRSSGGAGLAFMNAPVGSTVAFATSPGKTASDGEGKNGLYTSALLQYMLVPGLKLEEMFKLVRVMVSQKSDGAQVPWENTSLEGDFYMVPDGIMGTGELITDNNLSGAESNEIEITTFRDSRDNKEYRYVTLGKQVWMSQNLDYELDESWCYGNSSRYCRIYGRLYTYESALKACPDGWHLPSDEDWMELEQFLGMSFTEANDRMYRGGDAGYALRAKGNQYWLETDPAIRDEYNFSVLPAGIRNPDGSYLLLGEMTNFWSSTEYSMYNSWGRGIDLSSPGIFRLPFTRVVGASVRCIKSK